MEAKVQRGREIGRKKGEKGGKREEDLICTLLQLYKSSLDIVAKSLRRQG